MKILGIETSCDETAVAVVENGTKVLKNIIYSQIDMHAKTGGVVPEVAAREHILKIIPALDEINLDEIDAIAVTQGPGLISSLLTGTVTASTMALVLEKPLIPVNHIEGHIYANWLERDASEIQFPIVVLTVSGGHNELVLMRGHGDFEVIGETLDDAAGEAFDKVARLLGLGYPGGPYISKAAEDGNPNKYDLPRAWLSPDSFDFSFSGLKTAASRLPLEDTNNVAASFQEAVCDVLSEKLRRAAEKFGAKEVHLAGGVSANTRLREMVAERISLPLRFPKKIAYCTDNASMIAVAGYFRYISGSNQYRKWQNVEATNKATLL